MSDYQPIDCGLYDHLELAAMRGHALPVVYRDEDERLVELDTTVVDVFSREGAEYLRLGSGETVRLDRLVRVGATRFDGAAC